MGRADAEEVRHNRIGGRGLAEVPHNCRVFVASQSRCSPGGGGAGGAEDSLLEDQRRQFEVRVSNGAFWVGETDQLLGGVGWPLDALGVFLAVFVWVYPDPPITQAQSVVVAKVRCGPVDQLHKVGGAVCHISTLVAPELDVLVKSVGDVGRCPFCSSGVGEGDLNHIEFFDVPRHGEVHGAELSDESLQILDIYGPLAIGYLQKGDDLEASLGGKGEGTPLDVNHPSKDPLDCFPVSVPGQCFFQAGGVLHLSWQGRGVLLEGADGELGDSLFLGGVSLGGTKEAVHIDVYVLETFGRGCRAVEGLVRPRCGGVDHKGGGGFQDVAVGVIEKRIGCGTEEVG